MHTNSSPPTCQPGIHSLLPSHLDELVQCLESRVAVPTPVGTALVLQALSAALGPAARLVDGSMLPMAAELNTVILAPAGSTVPLAVQALLAPLLALQEELWALAAEDRPPIQLPGNHTNPADERARERPLIFHSSPAFEDLQSGLAGSFDGTVLTHHDAGSFDRFWSGLQADNNGSRWRSFQQLIAGRARVPKQGMARSEIVSLLIECRPDAASGREFLAAIPPDLCARFLVIHAGQRPTTWPADPILPGVIADRWDGLVRHTFARRGNASPLVVSVSPEAGRLFNQFHTELATRESAGSAAIQDMVFGMPALARRIALVLHLAGGGTDEPLEPAHAQAGIALARGYGEQMLAQREIAERELLEARQLADRQRVLARLKKDGVMDLRSLCRSFNDQSYARWSPVVEGLVAEGIVVELPDNNLSLAEHQLQRLLCV